MAAAPAAPQQPVYAAPPPMQPAYGAPYMPRPRVERNLQTLGILWCVYAAYRVIAGLIGMFFLRAFTMHSFTAPGWPFNHGFGESSPNWMVALMPLILLYTLLAVGLALVTGYSLLNRTPWGRTLAIIAAILALLKFPFGTALGIYTLWVLAPGPSGMEYDAIADRS